MIKTAANTIQEARFYVIYCKKPNFLLESLLKKDPLLLILTKEMLTLYIHNINTKYFIYLLPYNVAKLANPLSFDNILTFINKYDIRILSQKSTTSL